MIITLSNILKVNNEWSPIQVRDLDFIFPSSLTSPDVGGFVYLTEGFLKQNSSVLSQSWSGCFMTESTFFGIDSGLLDDKTVILVVDPKLAYAQLYNATKEEITEAEKLGFISDTAVVASSAHVAQGAYVGPDCVVGENSVIGPNAVLVSKVFIGENVLIGPCSVIGGSGFGYLKDDSGKFVQFPQVGGVIIRNNVDIGANTCIDSGALGPTIIGADSKIDNLVHIAHNVEIGKRSLVIAGAVICGSVTVGEDAWIAPGAVIREHLSLGDGVFVGLGSVVTKNLEANERVYGNPARTIPKK